MSTMTLKDAAGKVVGLAMQDLKWVAKKLVGAVPKNATQAELRAAVAGALQQGTTGEGAEAVVSDAAAEALAGVGDGKPASKKAEASAAEPSAGASRVTLEQAIAALNTLPTKRMAAVHEQVVGKPGKGLKKPALFRAVAAALENKAEGKGTSATLPDEAVGWLTAAKDGKQGSRAKATEQKVRDPRIPAAGTTLVREHRGERVEVLVTETGFLHNQKEYRSLSRIASDRMGCPVNGIAWFGLTDAAKEATARRAERLAAKQAAKEAKAKEQVAAKPEKKPKVKKATKRSTKAKKA